MTQAARATWIVLIPLLASGCAARSASLREPGALGLDARAGAAHLAPATQWYDPPGKRRGTFSEVGRTFELRPMGGFRFVVGGDAKKDDVPEEVSPLFGLSLGPNVLTRPTQAVGPYFLFLYNPVDDQEIDAGWDIFSFGGGVRYMFLYRLEYDIYVNADLTYTRWQGRGSDTILGAIKVEPRDLDGYALGLGLGTDYFFNETVGIGVGLTHRWYDGTDHFGARWIDLLVSLTFRL